MTRPITTDLRTCARDGCGSTFRPLGRPRGALRRYCSEACQRLDNYQRRYLTPASTLPTGTSGAISELIAGADLLRRGYDVFRALSPACSCDLIAQRGGELLRIEVRTGRRLAAGGLDYSKNATDAGRFDHYCIVVDAGKEIVYVPALDGAS